VKLAWHTPTLEERQISWLWGVTAVSSLLLRPFGLALAPHLPACPFRSLTGIPCPTCGTTHAAVALLHADLPGALAANPLLACALLVFFAGGALAPLWTLARAPIPTLPSPLPRWLRAAIVAALLANWAWVVIQGTG
jgi:Protein of unknown function (DUF2752)